MFFSNPQGFTQIPEENRKLNIGANVNEIENLDFFFLGFVKILHTNNPNILYENKLSLQIEFDNAYLKRWLS